MLVTKVCVQGLDMGMTGNVSCVFLIELFSYLEFTQMSRDMETQKDGPSGHRFTTLSTFWCFSERHLSVPSSRSALGP